MSEDNQSQSENQSQASSDNQTTANIENAPPVIQAVETQPKPEPSFGYIELSDDATPLTVQMTVQKRIKSHAAKGDKAD